MIWFDLAAVGFFDAEISQPFIHFVILYIWRIRFLIGGGFSGFVQRPANSARRWTRAPQARTREVSFLSEVTTTRLFLFRSASTSSTTRESASEPGRA